MMGGSSSALQKDTRPLFGLRPYADESFLGFTARLAAWNHFDSRHRFLRQIGFEHLKLEGLQLALEKPGRIAWLLRLSEEELDRLTARTEPEGEAYRTTIQQTRRCVSPASLRIAAYHRASWAQRLPFCPESWEVLIDKCPSCKSSLTWSRVRSVEICESCGFDLRFASTETVQAEGREYLSWLSSLIGPSFDKKGLRGRDLPQQISNCSRFDIFQLVVGLAAAKASVECRYDRSSVGKFALTKREAERLKFSVKTILRYPESFDEISASFFNGPRMRVAEFFRAARDMSGGKCRALYLMLYDDWEPCSHGPTRLKLLRQEAGQLSLREAAREMRICNSDLRRLLNEDLLPASPAGGVTRQIQWFRRDDVFAARQRLDDRMSLHEFSQTFQIPIYGAAQLISLGLISRNEDPLVNAIHDGVQLHRGGAEALIKKVQDSCRVPLPAIPLLSLEDAFQGVGAQEKPWGAIIHAALRREIPIYHAEDLPEKVSFRALQIPRALASKLVARKLPSLLQVPKRTLKDLASLEFSRLDVERYLNCFPRDVSWLIERGYLQPPFITREVAELAATIISSREISWRWRISPSLRNAMATDYGIERTVGPFWSRHEVEDYFSARFPNGCPI